MGEGIELTRSMPSGMAKATGAARAGCEIRHHAEVRPHDRHDHQLGNAFTDSDRERCLTPVPTGNQQLALIIAIDQADQIAQDNAMFVAQAGTRQHHSRQAGITDMNSHAGGDQLRLARLQG